MWQADAEEERVALKAASDSRKNSKNASKKGQKAATLQVEKILTFFSLVIRVDPSGGNCFPLIIPVLPVCGLQLPLDPAPIFRNSEVKMRQPTGKAVIRHRALSELGEIVNEVPTVEARTEAQ